MKIIVNRDRTITPIGNWGTENENRYEILDIEIPEEFENFNKRIVYYLDGDVVWDIIVDNQVVLTNAVTKYEKVQAYIWLTNNNDVDFRTKLFEMRFYSNKNADGLIPTEEEIDGFNDMLTAMNEKIAEVDNIDIDVSEKVDGKVTLTITKKDGTTEETEIVDGTDGVGLNYNWNGTELGIKREDESEYNYVDLKGDKGDTGATGQAGRDGVDGKDGVDGQDGYTPVKGTDYFTQSEINEFTTTITNNVNQNIGLRLDEINGEVI